MSLHKSIKQTAYEEQAHKGLFYWNKMTAFSMTFILLCFKEVMYLSKVHIRMEHKANLYAHLAITYPTVDTEI